LQNTLLTGSCVVLLLCYWLIIILHEYPHRSCLWMLQGEPEVRGTFWHAIIAIYRMLMGFYGMVRVDFSQPFSVKVHSVLY